MICIIMVVGDDMYTNIILKTVVLYFFIILSYRIMGKKEVGKLGIVDLIVSVLIAELAALSIEEVESSIFISIVPIVVLVVIQVVFGYISMKNSKIRNFVDGTPKIIIKDGKLNFSVMSKLRYTLDDLLSQLREQSVKSIEEVKYAILENNGKLSVFDKNAEYPLPIIIDGVVDYVALKDLHKEVKWITKMLEEKNLKLEDVFYAFYAKGKTFIIKKSDLL